MDAQTMSRTEDAAAAYEPPQTPVAPLKPALASIEASCGYMGGVSRAKFYADILPLLEIVKLGTRTFVVVESMDRLIEANRSSGLCKCKGPPVEDGDLGPIRTEIMGPERVAQGTATRRPQPRPAPHLLRSRNESDKGTAVQ
jgi:hypothetical protein